MPETFEFSLKDLKNWLVDEMASLIEPIKAEGMTLLNDTRDKLEGVADSCEKLIEDSEKEILKGIPKTYRRARTTYKFAQDVLEAIDELDIPDSVTYESLQMLFGDLEKTFATIGRERAKRFRQISPYFILDRRRFDGALKNAVESFKELRDFSLHGYKRVKAVEDCFVMIDKLDKSLNKLDKVNKQKREVESKIRVIQKEVDETERGIASIRSKDEVSELAQIKIEIEELEKALKRDLRYLKKPFLKFQKLIQGPEYRLPPKETRKLDQYVQHPFEALATEKKGYPQLRKILRGMVDAMVKEKLRLKRSRLRKAQKQINEILNKNSLAPSHEDCSKTFSKRQRLLTSKAIAISKRRRERLERRLHRLKKRKKLADSRMTVLSRRYKAELEDIKNQKMGLENAVLEITNKSIRVML